MGHRDREHGEQKPEEKGHGGKKGELQQQMELVNSLVEEVRTIDSEIDLLKQKMNLLIREINVLKRVVLVEKKEIKDLQTEEEQDKTRFASIVNIVKGIKDSPSDAEPPHP